MDMYQILKCNRILLLTHTYLLLQRFIFLNIPLRFKYNSTLKQYIFDKVYRYDTMDLIYQSLEVIKCLKEAN